MKFHKTLKVYLLKWNYTIFIKGPLDPFFSVRYHKKLGQLLIKLGQSAESIAPTDSKQEHLDHLGKGIPQNDPLRDGWVRPSHVRLG